MNDIIIIGLCFGLAFLFIRIISGIVARLERLEFRVGISDEDEL